MRAIGRSVLLVWVLYIVSFCGTTTANVLKDQREALQRIYSTFTGAKWTYNVTQIDPQKIWFNQIQQDPCFPTPWYGLTCSEDNTTIVNMTLRQFGLVGEFADDTFSGLNTTVKVDMYLNAITGELPASLLQSNSSMIHLDIGQNQLFGTIPSWIQYMSELEYFFLNENKLRGVLPQEVCVLSRLRQIVLYQNDLNGSIPSCIGDLVDLNHLYLGNNFFMGTIPASLYNCKNMYSLDLENNKLHGPLLDLLQFPNLHYVYLINNAFSGPIHNNITLMQELVVLGLSANLFTGSIPKNIGNLLSLRELYLYGNFLSGPIPESIESLSNLEVMLVQSNSLIGTVPNALRELKELVLLDISNNNMLGPISSSVFTPLVNLESLFLSNNQFTGPLPSMDTNLKLEKFDVSSNLFTGQIPNTLLTLPNLSLLSCAVNCLSREVSSSICESKSIKQLYLSGLAGAPRCSSIKTNYYLDYSTLPSCLWEITTLSDLYVSGNGQFGSIENLNLPSLQALDLSSNHIYGTFPGHAFRGKSMAILDIGRNSISGTFDPGINRENSFGDNTLKAVVNRLSGPLNIAVLGRFQQPDILLGGVYSCNTLPTNDKNYEFYSCGSIIYSNNVFIWLSVLVMFFAMFLYATRKGIVKEHDFIKYVDRRLSSNLFSFPSPVAKELIQVYRRSSLFEALGLALNTPDNDKKDDQDFHYTFSRQFVRMLNLCQKWVFYSLILVVTFTTLVYVAFKVALGGTSYNTHTYQYLYQYSGVYLKNWRPATILLIIQVSFLIICSYFSYVLFVSEWKDCCKIIWTENASRDKMVQDHDDKEGFAIIIMLRRLLLRLKKNICCMDDKEFRRRLKKDELERRDFKRSRVLRRWFTYFCRYLGGLIFMGMCVACDALVVLANRVDVVQIPTAYLYPFIFVIIIMKMILKNVVVSSVVYGLFEINWEKRSRTQDRMDRDIFSLNREKMDGYHHTSTSIKILGILFNFAVSLSPLIASLFVSDVCFRNVLNPASDISMQYNYESCALYSDRQNQCMFEETISKSLTFPPPFLYSNQCRNALLEIYVPYFIQVSTIDLMYCFAMYLLHGQIHQLEWHINIAIFGYDMLHYTAKDMLLPDVSWSVVDILSTFALLYTYGFVSGIAATAIGFDVIVKIELLRSAVKRYSHLEVESALKRDTKGEIKNISHGNSSNVRQDDKDPDNWQNMLLHLLAVGVHYGYMPIQWLLKVCSECSNYTVVATVLNFLKYCTTPLRRLAMRLMSLVVKIVYNVVTWLMGVAIALLQFLMNIFGVHYSGYFPENSKTEPIKPEITEDDDGKKYISYENFSKALCSQVPFRPKVIKRLFNQLLDKDGNFTEEDWDDVQKRIQPLQKVGSGFRSKYTGEKGKTLRDSLITTDPAVESREDIIADRLNKGNVISTDPTVESREDIIADRLSKESGGLYRRWLMQEFEKEKGGTFTLPKRRCIEMLPSYVNKQDTDYIFEAYGSMPDRIKFRQELMMRRIIDDDVYFELIEKNKADEIPPGIINSYDVLETWGEMLSMRRDYYLLGRLKRNVNWQNQSSKLQRHVSGVITSLKRAISYNVDTNQYLLYGRKDHDTDNPFSEVEWKYFMLDLSTQKEYEVNKIRGDNSESGKLEDGDSAKAVDFGSDEEFTFARKKKTWNFYSTLNRICYILKNTFNGGNNNCESEEQVELHSESLFQCINNSCKYGWISKEDRLMTFMGTICQKNKKSKNFLVENLDKYATETDIVQILENRYKGSSNKYDLKERVEALKKDLEDQLNWDNKRWIKEIKDVYDDCTCCHYGDFIELVNFEDDLETMISSAHGILHAAIFPGMSLNSFLFGLYVFEMSYDDEYPTLAAPLVMLFVAILFPYFGIYWYYSEYHKFEKRKTVEGENFKESFPYFLLQSYLNRSIIPVFKCNACRNPNTNYSKLRCNIPWLFCRDKDHVQQRGNAEQTLSSRSQKTNDGHAEINLSPVSPIHTNDEV